MSRLTIGLLASAFLFPSVATAQYAADEDIIIVTASPLDRSIDEAITGQSILAGDDLQDRLAATIGETLKLEPGVSSTSFGAGASRPIIRGQGGDRVRILTNGVGSIDASAASPDHAVAVEPAQAERIEVVRGAAILRYGSSGAGGVVNTIDGRIPNDFPDGQTDVTIRLGATSVDQGSEIAVSADQRVGNFVIHVDGTRREAGDYNTPVQGVSKQQLAADGLEVADDFNDNRRLANSFSESDSVTGGISYIGEKGFIGIAVHDLNSNYGIPDGDNGLDEPEEPEVMLAEGEEEEEGEETGVSIDLNQTRVDLNAGWNFDGSFIEKVQVFGGIADYEHAEIEDTGEVGTVFKNEGGEIRVEAIQADKDLSFGNWRAAHGVQYRERDFSAVGEEAFVPPTTTKQFGAFTFHELEVGDLHLEAAGRYERTNQENRTDDVDIDFDLYSISGGGDYHVSDTVRIGGTVFRTERAPSSEELFSNGPHLATNQFEVGDITLDKEVATGVEAAFRHRANGHSITLNAFYTDYQDYIFEAQTGETEDGLPVFQFTGEDAEFYGFEAVGQADITTVGKFDIGVDSLAEYVRAKTDSGNLPRIPPLSILSGLEAESDRFKLRAEWEYVAEADDLGAFELPTDDYSLVNGFVTWKAPIDATDVALRFSVLNIFDQEARQHTSFLKDSVPLPGRNFRFSITAKL